MTEPLWDWQASELETHPWNGDRNDKRALFAGTRLGKTRVAVELLRGPGAPSRGVVTTLLTAGPQWHRWMNDYGLDVIPGYRMSVAKVAQFLHDTRKSAHPRILLVNDDKLPHLADDILKWKPEALIVDESQRHRSPSAQRARSMRRIGKAVDGMRLLSGTPAPNHFGNLWGQMSPCDPETWGTYTEFKERFLVCDAVYKSKVLAVRNPEDLREMILERASIWRREDVFGPDSWQIVQREVDMPDEAWAAYHQLAKTWVLDAPVEMDTQNILVRMLRLQQITSGFLPLPEGGVVKLHSAKIDALEADLEEIVDGGGKAIVFHRFRPEGREAAEMLKRRQTEGFEINGDTGIAWRGTFIDRFANEPGAMVGIVQSQSGGTGISFAEAGYAHFLSRSFNFDEDMQARDRIFKPHEPRVVHYYTVPGTIDDYIAEVLAKKQNVHDAIRNADRMSLVYGTQRRKRMKL